MGVFEVSHGSYQPLNFLPYLTLFMQYSIFISVIFYRLFFLLAAPQNVQKMVFAIRNKNSQKRTNFFYLYGELYAAFWPRDIVRNHRQKKLKIDSDYHCKASQRRFLHTKYPAFRKELQRQGMILQSWLEGIPEKDD